MAKDQTAKLLWTSGWDSTFRLLQLVFVQKRSVQPYYMANYGRLSTSVELRQMDRIREAIASKDTSASQLIRDTIVLEYTATEHDPVLASQYNALKRRFFVGIQYLMLAEILKERDVRGVELCVHVDDRLHTLLHHHVEKKGNSYAMKTLPEEDPLNLLSIFEFPVLDLKKTDMEASARDHGFLNILEKSWFCHEPDSKGRPCGKCNPCRYTIREGLGRRVPWQGHVRNHLWIFVRIYLKLRRGLERLLPRDGQSQEAAK